MKLGQGKERRGKCAFSSENMLPKQPARLQEHGSQGNTIDTQ